MYCLLYPFHFKNFYVFKLLILKMEKSWFHWFIFDAVCRWHTITRETYFYYMLCSLFFHLIICTGGWCAHRTLASGAAPEGRHVLPPGSLWFAGRPRAPWQSGGRSAEHPALVLLETSLVYWTEIPLPWRSAPCCFVCGRGKCYWA